MHDVQDVHLGERLEVGLNLDRHVIRAEPERLDGLHPGTGGAENVGVQPVADEDRLVRRCPGLVERSLEDRRVRLAFADLRREHDGVDALDQPLALEDGPQQPLRARGIGDQREPKSPGSKSLEERMGRGREGVMRGPDAVRRADEEPQLIVLQVRALSGEGPAHHVGDVDLLLTSREQLRLVVREVAGEGLRRRKAIPRERSKAGRVTLEGDPVAPLLLHERPAPIEENRPQHRGEASPVAGRILWGSLALAPVTIVLHYATDIGHTAEFILASAALVPLAWLIGEATEHAAHHTGPGIGGFLNATFGNAPELIIALLAVHEGLTEVVRGSLTGSVVGNLLLVRESSMLSIGLVTLAVVLLLIPSVPGWEGDPERDSLVYVSIPISIALLIVYVGATWISLRRHRLMHISDEAADMAGWTFRTALIVLGIATVVTALIAEIVVGSIETFADKVGLTEFFVAAVIVAIVGNAAEHGGAVVVAARGQIKLAAEIALASSAQVAVFLIPAVTLLALLIDPLALSFRPIEIAALAFGVVLTFALLVQGQSSRARGVVLISGYVAVAVAFFFAGDR